MRKHTLGPWVYGYFGIYGSFGQLLVVPLIDGAPLKRIPVCTIGPQCPIGPQHFPSDTEEYANARLIAAAPDMLEALQSVIWAENNQPDHREDAIRHARAAIERATGEAQR